VCGRGWESQHGGGRGFFLYWLEKLEGILLEESVCGTEKGS